MADLGTEIKKSDQVYAEVFARDGKNLHSDFAVRERVYRLLNPLVSDKVVADIGCGDGYPATRIKALGARRIIGIDNEAMITKARGSHSESGINYIVGDALNLPLPDQSVDVAVSILVYGHFMTDQMDRANAEVARVLKPGGIFILVIPHPQNLYMQKPNIGWYEFHYKNPVYADNQVAPITLKNRDGRGVKIDAIYHTFKTYEYSLRKNGLNMTLGIDPRADEETQETYVEMGGGKTDKAMYRIYKAVKRGELGEPAAGHESEPILLSPQPRPSAILATDAPRLARVRSAVRSFITLKPIL